MKNAPFSTQQRPHHRTQYLHECDAYHLRCGWDFGRTKNNVFIASRDLDGWLGRRFEVSNTYLAITAREQEVRHLSKKVNLGYLGEARRNVDESGTRTHATYVTRKLTDRV
jgi:hypothetical protein